MSFITEVFFYSIFTDVHMRNNYHPNRAKETKLTDCSFKETFGLSPEATGGRNEQNNVARLNCQCNEITNCL